jgi:hypothetical protein
MPTAPEISVLPNHFYAEIVKTNKSRNPPKTFPKPRKPVSNDQSRHGETVLGEFQALFRA